MSVQILQVVREFSLEGGVETVAVELQRAWERMGVAATVMASVVGDHACRCEIRRISPWLAAIGTRGKFRYLGRIIAVPWFTLAATQAVRQERSAVVLSHGDTLAGDVMVVHAVNKASIAVKRAHGSHRWRLNPMHLWIGWRDRRMIGGLRYRHYIAVSNRIAVELSEYYAVPVGRITVIGNGINLERFAPVADARSSIRGAFSIPQDAPLLLFAGHEFERKGLAFAIDALTHLPPDTHLLAVGADDPTSFARMAEAKGLERRVRFAGGRSDMPVLYQAADAFVLPTAYESFSLVCMEAMACGLPVFATRAGGIEDYLQDGINGYAIERNPTDIAAKIGMVLRDSDLTQRLAAGAYATARRYDWTNVARMYADLLGEVDRERGVARDRV